MTRKTHWTIRLLLGGIIAVAGVAKLLDISGFAAIIRTYQFSLSDSVVGILAAAIPIFELGLGVWILSGYALRKAAVVSMLMHAGYGTLLTIMLIRGIHLTNCGCFGVFLARPLQWYTPLEDVALIYVSYKLFKHARKRTAHS